MDALDEYVEELRRSKGQSVPEFSSSDGRMGAKVLFLLGCCAGLGGLALDAHGGHHRGKDNSGQPPHRSTLGRRHGGWRHLHSAG